MLACFRCVGGGGLFRGWPGRPGGYLRCLLGLLSCAVRELLLYMLAGTDP